MTATPPPLPGIVGSSPAMAAVRRMVHAAIRTDVPVLLEGETGTGKTLVARVIHEAGRLRDAPFLPVNCAGIPEALFESELFGHQKGSFTGATGDREGLVEAAAGGTLFLDEIGDLPISQQGKMLTVLEDREVRRVGARRARPVRFRLISATGRDLVQAASLGSFRRDLLHRISVLRCVLPPLRERKEDLPRLVRSFTKTLAQRYALPDLRLSDDAVATLERHPWPGNIRELSHVLEAAVILADGPRLTRRDIERVIVHDTEAA